MSQRRAKIIRRAMRAPTAKTMREARSAVRGAENEEQVKLTRTRHALAVATRVGYRMAKRQWAALPRTQRDAATFQLAK